MKEVWDTQVDNVIKELFELKEKGEEGFFKYNGKIVKSSEISSRDDFFIAIYGQTEEEYKKSLKESLEKTKIEQEKIKVDKIKKAETVMPQLLGSLKDIKKQDMDERVFYENVLENLNMLYNSSLTPELLNQLRETLKDIGCSTFEEWKAEKEAKGEKVIVSKFDKGIKNAELSWGVSMVGQFIFDDIDCDGVNYAKEKYIDEYSQEWIDNSKLYRFFNNPIKYALNRDMKEISNLIAEVKNKFLPQLEPKEENIEQEVEDLSKQVEELKEKNQIVDRLANFSKERDELNEEISLEEAKKEENLKKFNKDK